MTVYAIVVTVMALCTGLLLLASLKRCYQVQEAAHRAADELDEWDGYAAPGLGGASPGGVVRFEIHKAAGHPPTGEGCPVCRRGIAPSN